MTHQTSSIPPTLSDDEAAARLRAGVSIRRGIPGGEFSISVRRHRICGFVAEGAISRDGYFRPFDIRPPGAVYDLARFSLDDAVTWAVHAYRLGECVQPCTQRPPAPQPVRA